MNNRRTVLGLAVVGVLLGVVASPRSGVAENLSEAEVNVTDVVFDGGWFAPETTKVPKEAVDALVNASANVVGASYHPVALLGTQVVAGINFCMLCEVTPATENPEPHYAIVIAGQGVNGATYTLQTYDFTAEDAE